MMSDSDDTEAAAAFAAPSVDGAVAAPHDFLSSSSEEEEDEAPSQKGPSKKRKATGSLLTRWKKTTRRVSGEQETPSPGTANNLLEGRVNDLESEVETLEGKLAVAEDNRKQANARVSLLNKEVKLLKEEKKVLGAEETAQEVVRLKRELASLSDASVKATRLGEELAIDKTTVKDLRLKVSKGTTAYEKLKNKYYQLKENAGKAQASLKKTVNELKSEMKEKVSQLKMDETKIAAQKAARDKIDYNFELKMRKDEYSKEQKEAKAKEKEAAWKANIAVAQSASSHGAFSIPQNQQELEALIPLQQYQAPQPGHGPTMQQYQQQPHPMQPYQPHPMQQYQQPYQPHPMQQYQQPYQPHPMQQYQQPYQPHPMQPYQPQYQPPTQYQPGMSQIYPPPPTMERASSGASITPTPQEQGDTYTTAQEMEEVLAHRHSLGIPDEEEEVGASQSSEATPDVPYAT